MAVRLKRHISQKFDNEIRFIKGMLNGPKTVGAIAPTSIYTARRMASVIDLTSDLPVLELGPGTGVITKAILERGVAPEKLVAIEYSADFHSRLVEDFPGVKFIHGDAFDLTRTLAPLGDIKFQTVVSGIPLLNFPMAMRIKLLEDLLDRLPVGRPVIQFSYGPVSPIAPKPESYHIQHFDFMIRNIPPAQLWIYRRG
ncbi:phospholipid N-methyltransferase PmtA [Rhizobium sp. RU36D]|uniref:phospholipid N-methyltransferase PmtA n=1 Tax=Rhizobium sp. RU36D TaxID=1907415 RepID=UPI0009D87C80|nr:class I SAM-dependent methyltransferase [Rhizobium sp. RU36D]SMD16994.1 phosphatidylethanolamine N-methyltransferase /phosphatidyl-N-methylethanolamine N-methyltransferase [Rhizobium sp. RU36D]